MSNIIHSAENVRIDKKAITLKIISAPPEYAAKIVVEYTTNTWSRSKRISATPICRSGDQDIWQLVIDNMRVFKYRILCFTSNAQGPQVWGVWSKHNSSITYSNEYALFCPGFVFLKLTNNCNLSCNMCGQRGFRKNDQGYLPFTIVKKIIDDTGPYQPEVYLWGGEPLLHPEIGKIIRYINNKGLRCVLNTNGTLLGAKKNALREAKIDCLILSLYGTKDIHELIVGKRNIFESIINGAHKIDVAASIIVNVVITRLNYLHLEAIVLSLRDHGFSRINFQFPMMTTAKIGYLQEKFYKDFSSTKAARCRGFLTDDAGINVIRLKAEIKRIKEAYKHVRFSINISENEMETYFYDIDKPLRERCTVPWKVLTIESNGDVAICPDFPDYIVGTVTAHTSIMGLWNNNRFRMFRRYFTRQRTMPVCSRCCNNFKFGRRLAAE